ncbi:MAG: HlyD family efflux transporter periplasmic adaptor subunit [Candidatus Eisenbacteria bacterium]
MDIPRQKPKSKRTPILIGIGVLVVAGTVGLSQLRPAAPRIERGTLWIDTVKRGEMLREVRGNGTLVPEDLRIVSALTAGRVDRVLVRPGAKVEIGTVLLEMSNPDVQLQALDAERQVKLAEADLAALRAALESGRLAAVSTVAEARRAANEAERALKVAERLSSEGLTSSMDIDRARDNLEEAKERQDSEKQRLALLTESLRAQLSLRQSEVERLRAISRFQGDRISSMTVRAGQKGVLQSLSLQPGQWVNPGQELARVAGQDRLKAVVRIPETQARDLAIGLMAAIDTRNGIVKGHVARIDPGAQNGTVSVDLALDGVLPRGARPDLSVDATIEIERLPDVIYVGRPADGSSEATVGLFVLEADGHHAKRVSVDLGRGSANSIEVRKGLKPGDQVILSEMTRWDSVDRVKLQ